MIYVSVFTSASNAEEFVPQWVDATGPAFYFLVRSGCHVSGRTVPGLAE